MQIVQGGKPAPEPKEDPTIKYMLITHSDLDEMLKRGEITPDQYAKLIEEVPL